MIKTDLPSFYREGYTWQFGPPNKSSQEKGWVLEVEKTRVPCRWLPATETNDDDDDDDDNTDDDYNTDDDDYLMIVD